MMAISIPVIFCFIIMCYNIVAVKTETLDLQNTIRHVCLWGLTNEKSVCKTSQLCHTRV